MIKDDLFQDKDAITQYLSFLKRIRNHKKASIRKCEFILRNVEQSLGEPLWCAKKGSQIEEAIIKAAETRKKKYNGGVLDMGEQYRFRLGITVAAFLRWLHQEGFIDRNPFGKNSFRRPTKKEAYFLTHSKLKYLLNFEGLSVMEHALVRFALDTAARRFEIIAFKLKDIDFENRIAMIHQAKGDAFRSVPFTERTLFWLETYLAMRKNRSDYLFTRPNGESFNHTGLGEVFMGISKKIGFRVNAHSLRHTAGTMWIDANIQQALVMRFLGHTDDSVTHQYIHVSASKLKDLQEEVYKKNSVVFASDYK